MLQEGTEECGLTCVRVLRLLAEEHTPHPIRRFPRHTTFFELEVDGEADVPDAWDHHVTGTGRDNGMTSLRPVAGPPPGQPGPEDDTYTITPDSTVGRVTA